MLVRRAEFVSSHADVAKCPSPDKPEFAFIGRSNVGKSSLINMLTGSTHLAKTSGRPGKTQTINHFIINDSWYLVDLPGYGYASISKSVREAFPKMIEQYMLRRENLCCVFVLLDVRLEPQKNDLSFIEWAGSKGIPLALIFTKADKLSKNELAKKIAAYSKTLLHQWEELPPIFATSAETRLGKEDVLEFVAEAADRFSKSADEE